MLEKAEVEETNDLETIAEDEKKVEETESPFKAGPRSSQEVTSHKNMAIRNSNATQKSQQEKRTQNPSPVSRRTASDYHVKQLNDFSETP